MSAFNPIAAFFWVRIAAKLAIPGVGITLLNDEDGEVDDKRIVVGLDMAPRSGTALVDQLTHLSLLLATQSMAISKLARVAPDDVDTKALPPLEEVTLIMIEVVPTLLPGTVLSGFGGADGDAHRLASALTPMRPMRADAQE